MDERVAEILARLPGKNCGQCGFKTCAALADYALRHPDAVNRCVYLESGRARAVPPPIVQLREADISWQDILGREYDLILEQFTEDPGPREVILPFNPLNVERLGVKKGDILFGRPAWVGCPVTHVGLVMEDPDLLSGTITWCVVGPMRARERGIEIGQYHIIAYEGLVWHTRKELHIGGRYFFLPRYCMLHSRHSGVISAAAKRGDALRVRLEGIWIA
ncbi:MAG TPA: Fe-S cluster protein [Gammaproteobacteria bacterium]|nr:Fe-S cluster protein [Gammaproteobacteria bacterium]